MAKKNLTSLINGLMGEAPVPEETSSSTSNDSADTRKTEIVDSKRKVGRPPKPDNEKSDEVRATFVVSDSLLRKVKYISLVDSIMQKEILNNALSDYVEKWESINGKIKLPERK